MQGQPDPLTGKYLANAADGDYLLLKKDTEGGETDAPVYVRVTIPDNYPDYYDLEYWFLYGYNGHATARVDIKLGKLHKNVNMPLGPFGEHQGDWEHAVVRLDANLKMAGLYVAAHSGGEWFLPAV